MCDINVIHVKKISSEFMNMILHARILFVRSNFRRAKQVGSAVHATKLPLEAQPQGSAAP